MIFQASCHLVWRALACQRPGLGVVARVQLLVVTPSAARPFIDFAIDLDGVVSPLRQQWLQDGTYEEVAYDSGR